jgi:activator of HSP90 ATPase
MPVEFTVSAVIPATPAEVYRAWLDSAEHSAMTGSPARVSARIGDTFTAWNGYISGDNFALEPTRRIRQWWRTRDFKLADEDSLLEILFEPHAEGTLITIHHSLLPANGWQYRDGWIDSYFTPMQEYFRRRPPAGLPPQDRA